MRPAVYNVIGQKVAVLVDGEREAGMHRIVWNASGLPSGVYFAPLKANNFIATKKMVLLP